MDRAMPLNGLEMRRLSANPVAGDRSFRGLDSAAENARLAQEIERLRRRCDELTASAETWIRLYESALARANAAEAREAGSGTAGATGQGPRG